MPNNARGATIDRMFRAVSDPTRLRILRLLQDQGELCVGDLVGILRAPQPTVSRHLGYLRRARLVTARRQGLWGFYSLAPAAGEFHRKLIACLSACFDDVPELARDRERAERVRARGGCCPTPAAGRGRGRRA